MKIKYDREADALYITFTENKINESSEDKSGGFILDYDVTGSLVGIEILNATRKINNPAKIDYEEI